MGTRAWTASVVSLAAGLAGCLDPAPVSDGRQALLAPDAVVGDMLSPAGCSTDVVRGLSLQIAQEMNCAVPGAMVAFGETDQITFEGPQVLPLLEESAVEDLYAAAAAADRELVVQSGFRSIAQQFLIYEWFTSGHCGFADAASPGSSNHETGRAVDVENWELWVEDLAAFGWDQTVPGDEVHFDHLASPDNRGLDVLAFQRLWNRNNPSDPIDEDGLYGPMTEGRVMMSPVGGFEAGPDCEHPGPDPDPDPDPDPAPDGGSWYGGCAGAGTGAPGASALALLGLALASRRRRRT
jgi:uncharacterized protein (TIGR03382 family)